MKTVWERPRKDTGYMENSKKHIPILIRKCDHIGAIWLLYIFPKIIKTRGGGTKH